MASLLLLALCDPPAAAQGGEPLTPDQALSRVLAADPELLSMEARVQAERSAIRAQYAPENPRVGFGREVGMSFMEQQMGPMNFWSVSQGLLFPSKYFQRAKAQSYRADAAARELEAKRLETRTRVFSAYYHLFASERILALLDAQRETLRQIARIAETRHATGAVPQQDEMKAHFEQTKIENDLLILQEEREEAESTLNSLMARDAEEEIALPKGDPPIPSLTVPLEQVQGLAHSDARHVQHQKFRVDEAEARKNLAVQGYLPDFNLSYRKAFTSAPSDNYAFGIELSMPLWFAVRQSSEVATSAAEVTQAEKELEKTMLNTHAEIRTLVSKVRNHGKLVEIYKTSLIPQASSTLNSSRSAYQAGRASFTELLDSERAVYETQVAYYRTLADYVSDLSQLEEMSGARLSTLPFPGEGVEGGLL